MVQGRQGAGPELPLAGHSGGSGVAHGNEKEWKEFQNKNRSAPLQTPAAGQGSSQSGNPTESPLEQITAGCSGFYLCSGRQSGAGEAQRAWVRTGLGESCREWSGNTRYLGCQQPFKAGVRENSEIKEPFMMATSGLSETQVPGSSLNPHPYYWTEPRPGWFPMHMVVEQSTVSVVFAKATLLLLTVF